MDIKELVDAAKAGKTIEARYDFSSSSWSHCDIFQSSLQSILNCIKNNSIRIKPLAFQTLPEGDEWYNPDNLTPEQVEVDKGWRLRTKWEVQNITKPHTDEIWYKNFTNSLFYKVFDDGIYKTNFSYRTKDPLYQPKDKTININGKNFTVEELNILIANAK